MNLTERANIVLADSAKELYRTRTTGSPQKPQRHRLAPRASTAQETHGGGMRSV
jgi:hypothetical protein